MPFPIESKLVIGIASSALFDLTESNQVFESQGADAYRAYQEQRRQTPLAPGVAFPFIQRLLSLNEIFADEQPVEVVLFSRNSPETGELNCPSRLAHTPCGFYEWSFTLCLLAGIQCVVIFKWQ